MKEGLFMPICVYCGHDIDECDLSQEHIIPKAIGGNLMPANPFVINNVCKRCNNLCGAYIDGPFIKNWLVYNARVENINKYTTIPKSGGILPLRYMGVLNDIRYEEKKCELWLGPTGDTIYHFHKAYPSEPNTSPMVGVPTFLKNVDIDHGFAFLFIRSNNPAWHYTILKSFAFQFNKSVLYLGNGSTPMGGKFSDIPFELQELHSVLKSRGGSEHKGSIEMRVSYGDRFLAKLALGIGALTLDQSFVTSKSADLLRKFMWSKDAMMRAEHRIMGTGFVNNIDDRLKKTINLPGGHIILLLEAGGLLNLYTSFYGTQNALIVVSTESEHWREIINGGLVFFVAPSLQSCIGPIDIGSFIAHKVEPGFKNQQLSDLEKALSTIKEHPPYMI